MSSLRSARGISSVEMKSEYSSSASSVKDSSAQSCCQFSGRAGSVSGMYSPPFLASPARTAWERDGVSRRGLE